MEEKSEPINVNTVPETLPAASETQVWASDLVMKSEITTQFGHTGAVTHLFHTIQKSEYFTMNI
jgi:hypothetical protein